MSGLAGHSPNYRGRDDSNGLIDLRKTRSAYLRKLCPLVEHPGILQESASLLGVLIDAPQSSGRPAAFGEAWSCFEFDVRA